MRVREKRNMSICKTIYIGRKEIQLEGREIMKIKKTYNLAKEQKYFR